MSASTLYKLLEQWAGLRISESNEKQQLALQILDLAESVFLNAKKKKVDITSSVQRFLKNELMDRR